MSLATAQRQRLCGALLGAAGGDALGAPLEVGPVVDYPRAIAMSGGGWHGWTPGEWTYDTSMAVLIARAMLGAIHGIDAIPADWQDLVHGWPGIGAADLLQLADSIIDGTA